MGVQRLPAWFVVAGLSAVIVGCGGGRGAEAGSETGPCYPNTTCNAGLTCLSNLCVRVDLGNDAGADLAAGTGGEGGSRLDAAPDAPPFQPAAHPRLPQVANRGGPVLERPKVLPIFYDVDSSAADIEAFLTALARASYWREVTAEYGVGPLQVLPAVRIPGTPPATISDAAIRGTLGVNTSGTAPPWGAPDPSTVYLIVLPQGTAATFPDGSTCCQDFGGYHFETQTLGVTLPYAVGCSCPGALGTNLTTLQERTVSISHELVEVATDPFPNSNPAYRGQDYANYVWTYLTGGETADLCSFNPDTAYALPGTSFLVQRSWSNAAAARADNPCVPVASKVPYFNSFAQLEDITFGTVPTTYPTRGLQIPLGGTRAVDVTLFSAGPIAGKWSVSAYTLEDWLGGDRSNLGVSLDPAQGGNGDHLLLTLTPRRANPGIGGEAFVLVSQYGRAGDPDFQTNLSMGLIRN